MKELLNRLRAAWDNLSPREQLLCTIAGASVAFCLLVFVIVMPFVNLADRTEQRALGADREVLAMLRLQREYLDIQSRLATVEERIRTQQGRSNIRTLLENLAQEAGVKIDSMEERKAGNNDHYVESKVEVSLKNVSLRTVVSYLHRIESSDQQLSVKSLRIKGKQDRSQLLNVTFAVSSFRTT